MLDGVYTIEVLKCTFDDAGDYKITAENEGGVVYCEVNVNVLGKFYVLLLLFLRQR